MKFAKLFDVADTQVLAQLSYDDEGLAKLSLTTMNDGVQVAATISFGNDEDKAEELAMKALELYSQEGAERFYTTLLAQLMCGGEA